MHYPLHVVGYFLNPAFFYSNPNIEQDNEVMSGLYNCISKLVTNIDVQDKIIQELSIYKQAENLFGLPMAIRQRATTAPGKLFYPISLFHYIIELIFYIYPINLC